MSDETTFEELDELCEEVNEIKFTSEHRLLVDRKEITSINDLQPLLPARIKGWLFNYYSVSVDYQKNDAINRRSINYLHKIKESTSCDYIAHRNSILIQRRNQERH